MWEQSLDMAAPAVVAAARQVAGLPAGEVLAATQGPAIKQQLRAATGEAHAHGAFGSPIFFVGSQMFFGKDRLREVEEEIVAQGAGRQ